MVFLFYIFSNFWTWLGFVILVAEISGGVVELVKACKRNRKVTVVKDGEHIHTTIENATKDEAKNAVLSAAYTPNGKEQGNEQ